ncbi:phosphoprotein phosphatase [Thioalkalivibrio denitrificans]|uniref:Phosphoprotein phosphatase n=1 Tax=Thioalkalivibrio denitrificans TaxID=108003 RepID=A0A1V3NJB0_9GAMM|nr:metallophosphoesterase [Thioalkalivibrio denitrificans]OOG25197.1 phosphoprotein phosphatase [Thioalkalivibrio denitrificans]
MSGKIIERLKKNSRGRDFAVGDLHGMFTHLEHALEALEFDPELDRLLSVGDLIDRGPESHRALEFLERPWFHAIQGNHERLLLDSESDADMACTWVALNGGEWWRDVDKAEQARFRRRMRDLPYLMEVDTDQGKVGLVHADIPLELSWQDFVDKLADDERLRDYAVWSRKRINLSEASGEVPPVDGIDLVIMGHTPLQQAVHAANIYYLDTGAAYADVLSEAKLSILQIHPEQVLTEFPTGTNAAAD